MRQGGAEHQQLTLACLETPPVDWLARCPILPQSYPLATTKNLQRELSCDMQPAQLIRTRPQPLSLPFCVHYAACRQRFDLARMEQLPRVCLFLRVFHKVLGLKPLKPEQLEVALMEPEAYPALSDMYVGG